MKNLLTQPVTALPNIGDRRGSLFEKLGIRAIGDLLEYFPRGYEDRTQFSSIGLLKDGDKVSVDAVVTAPATPIRARNGLQMHQVTVSDGSGTLNLIFFNSPFAAKRLCRGERYLFYGKVSVMGGRKRMTNPVCEPSLDDPKQAGRIMPLYPLTAGLSQWNLQNAVKDTLERLDEAIPDPLPSPLRVKYNLPRIHFALQNIHFPENGDSLNRARRRLVFEELLLLKIGLSQLKKGRRGETDIRIPKAPRLADLAKALGFTLTGAQKRALQDIFADLNRSTPMNRLVQGDVGCGKTAVALFAMFAATEAGYQTAMMAPTEILARQHAEFFDKMLSPFGVRTLLLTGHLTAAEKRNALKAIADGDAQVIIGTHAVIQEDVVYQNLGLVVTDEQHRFGVSQRAALSQKGKEPHTLVMSATPIPRTLALLLYGDLDLSVIDELPPNRKPIRTILADETLRDRVWGFVKKTAAQGRQVYVVCPMVSETGEEDLKSAKELYRRLSHEVFPDLRVGLLYGKQKAAEKQEQIRAFTAGETDLLVSTTVVEVGVNVPNATLMIVENAERFGLSQLHQLRGRVGRGGDESFCILFSESGSARERLQILAESNDGFKVSERDLELRGPGDFFGTRQHGAMEFKLADLTLDRKVFEQVLEAEKELLSADPELRMEEHRLLREEVVEKFAKMGQNQIVFN